MTIAFQRMFGILERWNNNRVTPSLSKPHELSYRSNTIYTILTENLGKKKVCARFVPHQLNEDKKVNEFLMKKKICVINHPPYSPDISPCDYFLFPKLKTALKEAFYDDVPTI